MSIAVTAKKRPSYKLEFMVLFHLIFLLLGVLSLALMANNIISFNWAASLVIVTAIFLNAIFGILWVREVKEVRVGKRELPPETARVYSMVSFVVPAYDKERDIMRCVNSLFKCAVGYRGPSEIIIVDDGSTDNTFEVAWATVNSKQQELAHIGAKVVRHLSRLGKAEAVRTGVNKAMGEYIVIVDADTFCDPAELTSMVDFLSASERLAVARYVHPSAKATAEKPNIIRLYRAEALRRLMNEKGIRSMTEDLKLVAEKT